MGWQDDPITVAASPAAAPAPWQNDPIVEPRNVRTASGVLEAIQAGWQGSIPGLVDRKALPDIVLDPHHAKWYEKAAAGFSQVVNELPEMIVGGIIGSAAGTPAGPIGVVGGGGAGAFGIPAAIRTSLIEAYKSGTVDSSGGFLASAKIVIGQTAKEMAVGAATTLAGMGIARVVGSAITPSIGTTLTTKTAERVIGGASTTAEIGTMVVTPAALEGKLPEWEDFLNAAIVVGGLKASVGMASKIGDIYAKTGTPPEVVVALAKQDPTIARDLKAGTGERPLPTPVDTVDWGLKMMKMEGDAPVGDAIVSRTADNLKTVTVGGEVVAKADIRQSGEEIVISKIETLPTARRQGYATMLVDDLISEFPGSRVVTTMRTDAGRAFFEKQYNNDGMAISARGDLPRAFQAEAAAESARNAILLPEQARAFVEKPFAEVPQAPGTPKVKLNVNYDYINTPAEAQAALARASELYGPQIAEQTRGKVSWEKTEMDAAKALAEMTGARDLDVFMSRKAGDATNAVDLKMRVELLNGATEDFVTKWRSYDPAKTTPEQQIQMWAAAERSAMMQAQFLGASAEAGRALNILKDARQAVKAAEEVQRLLKTYDRDPATIAAILKEIDNPVAAARAAREITRATPWEKVAEGLKSVMLSGPITWGANIVGNATFLPLRPVIDAVAAPLGVARQVLSGTKADRTRAVEPIARIMGNWQGAVDALMAAGSFMRMYGTRPMEGLRELDKMGARKAEVDKRAIEGDLGVLARTPFLALSIPDRMFRMMIERGEVNALAAREAAKDGHSPYSREFRERMADARQNLTPEQMKAVEVMGDRGTFNADLGPLGKSVQDVIRKMGPLGFLIAPFVRTPLNLMKETLRLTPAAPIIDTWRADIAAGGARADKALAEVVVGGTIASVVIGLAMSGKISGAGDTDPDKSRVKLAAGEQPYSFQAGDGKWYEYSRLQPLGTVMGLAADFSQIWDKFENPDERDKVAKMIAVAFSNAITNQTMLMGLSNIIRAISEPDRYGERYLQSIVAMPVPGALSQTAQLNDPYIREIHTIMDAVKNKIPGERETLQPKIDVWGDPVQNRERVAGAGPVRILEESDDKVKTEAARLGVSVPKTAENIVMPGSKDRKIGKVELTPEQQTAYAVVAGKQAYSVMETIVNSASWDKTPDMIKRQYYELAFERARKAARAQVFTPEQRMFEAERIRSEVAKQLAPPAK